MDKIIIIMMLAVLSSCGINTTNITKKPQKTKTSVVYQVTPQTPNINPNAISKLSNRDVGNIQGIADYLSSAFLTRHKDNNSQDGFLTAYEISYITNIPNSFGGYIRCNKNKEGIYNCNPKDTYVCKQQICKGKDYKTCMPTCPAISSSDEIGAAWINKNLDDPVMFFSLPQKSECHKNQNIGDNNCSWKVEKSLGSVSVKEILEEGLKLKPSPQESPEEKQVRVEQNTTILKNILIDHKLD